MLNTIDRTSSLPLHVVHVEDDKPLRGILRATFRASEPAIDLHQFVSADEAVSYIESNWQTIDLFILDIRLPGEMNGLELAQKIRALNCPGYVVLTSAYSPPSREFLTEIRSEYYPKPWHILELTEKLLKYRLATPKPETPKRSPAKTAPLEPPLSKTPINPPQAAGTSPEKHTLPPDPLHPPHPPNENDHTQKTAPLRKTAPLHKTDKGDLV
ncbi:MAG: response regulator [Chloroflexota bacterium]